MDSKGQIRLNYTEDFRVACGINNLQQEDVLQYFINKVSFYAFNGGEMDATSVLATNIVLECVQETGGHLVPLQDKKIRKIFLKHMRYLTKLNANRHLNVVEKMQESIYLMEEWAMEMLPLADYEKSIKIDDEKSLILTFDFNLLCKINGLDSIQVVQYFIDKISLPVERAVNLNGFVKAESCMVFMQMMLTGKYQRSNFILDKALSKIYVSKLQDLDERLKKVKELGIRISAYRAFYHEWYHESRKNIN